MGDKIPDMHQSYEPLATISYYVRLNSRRSSITASALSTLSCFLVMIDGDLFSWNREVSIGGLGQG